MEVDQSRLDEAIARRPFTGVIAIDVGEQRVLERAEGFLHRAHGVPMRADARIAIASGSKAFTALAILRLVEQGALRLDQPVRELLGGGSMGVYSCWVYGVPMEPLLLWLWLWVAST